MTDDDRIALAQAQEKIGQLMAEYQDQDGLTVMRQERDAALARGDNLAKELSERNAHMDELHDALTERDAEITRLKAVVEDGQSEDRVKRLVNALYHIPTRTEEAAGTIIEASDVLLFQSREIAKLKRQLTEAEAGASAAWLQNAAAREEIARLRDDRNDFERALAEQTRGYIHELKAEIARLRASSGASALEATRDLFQALEGWRPTNDWTGVPPRKKLLFDRSLHAIRAAEAHGRAAALEEAARIADDHPDSEDCKFADFEDPEILRGCVEVIAGRIRALSRNEKPAAISRAGSRDA